MERLTAINENGRAYYPECFEKCDGIGSTAKCDHCKVAEAACERLVAYENTGITPEQICDLDRMYRDLATEYGKYKKAEEQGLLLKLPCKVGDTVYTNLSATGWFLRKKNRPYAVKIAFIGINGKDNLMNVVYENGNMTQFPFSQIGKTVFLTRTEAEEALQKKGE